MSGKDIDLCDSLELIAFIAKETEYFCTTVSDCGRCPCQYIEKDDIYNCRKEHLLQRKKELENGAL